VVYNLVMVRRLNNASDSDIMLGKPMLADQSEKRDIAKTKQQ
jgi:hypothetical protein